jgi:Acetyltransferase (GNAT) domain
MHGGIGRVKLSSSAMSGGTMRIATRGEIASLPRWQTAFAGERKDRRFYELLEDTVAGFGYGYLVAGSGEDVSAIQPYFIIDQDLAAGTGGQARNVIAGIRRLWPRFMRARTLMVGCAAGEGHLDGGELVQSATAELLAGSLRRIARELNCVMVVLKEFPAKYRGPLEVLQHAGFTRVPSMPMTTLAIDFKDFEQYVDKTLSPRTRGKVRRKLRAAERAKPAITMSAVDDVAVIVDEIYPLYLGVYERSPLQFERLSKEFLCEIVKRMPDKARIMVWRQDEKIIAFGLCTVQGDAICHEYVGFDYAVAFKLNLYYRVFRDIIEWAIANGYKRFYSGSLNYDPKWHLRQSLYPIDLYVRHTSGVVNALFRKLLPLLEPTRSDPTLPNFHNYRDLWA